MYVNHPLQLPLYSRRLFGYIYHSPAVGTGGKATLYNNLIKVVI